MEDAKKLQELQQYQMQLQNVMIQKQELMIQKAEIEEAMRQLEKSNKNEAMKIVGNIIVTKNIEDIKKELQDKYEFVKLKLENLEKLEKKLIKNISELQG